MEQKVIEGTWEEVASRSQELAGHRVRVTVLDGPVATDVLNETETRETEATAFDIFKRAGLIGCLKGEAGAPTDLATNPAHMEGFGGE